MKRIKQTIKTNKYLIAILSAYLLLQLVFVIIGGISPQSDSDGYVRLAKEAIERGEAYPSSFDFIFPYIWNSGYINFIALCLALFNSITSVIIIQAIMNTLSALFLFLFVEKTLKKRSIAWVCFVLFVLYPSNLAHTASALTEVPFFFFFISGFYFSICKNKWLNLLGGILFALANWVRPLLIMFVPVLIYYLYKEKELRKLVPTFVGLAFMILIIGGDVYLRTGRFIFQANTSWYNIAMTCDDDAPGTFNSKVFEEGEPMYIPDRNTMDYREINKIYKERCIDYMIKNPLKMIKQIPNRFIRFYLNDTSCIWAFVPDKKEKTTKEIVTEGATSTIWTKFPHYDTFQYIFIYSQLYYYFILITFVAGAIKAYRKKEATLATPFLLILVGTLLTIAVISVNRYHHALIPFMMIFSAYYLSDVGFVKRIMSHAKI